MNSFGLGLVLNFTDNASAGMNRAAQTFTRMSDLANQMVDSADQAAYSVQTLAAAGFSLDMVGSQMTQAGQSILGFFTNVSKNVIDTGLEVQGFERQLAALYGSDEAGKQKMAELKQYALDSVFEVRSLMTSVSTMKAVGIEAMNDITTSSGKTTQKLMDYASDLAAMFPNMRNAYGSGIEAAMGAMKEYIAEGNALSLKRGAGLDITGLLGEEKGATIEERTRQVADLIEVMGIAGYTTSLLGTPSQQLSKMQDALYNSFSKIAEQGVLPAYTNLLSTAADYVSALVEDEDKMNTLTQVLGETITALITPLQTVLNWAIKVVDAFLEFAETHPAMAKTVLTFIAFGGVALVVLGTVLKLSGSFFLLASSLTQMSSLASNGISIFNVLGRALGIVGGKFLPLASIAGIVYFAWSRNLFGIRDLTKNVFSDISAILSLSFDALADGTLSEEQFQRMNELGIRPFIESLLILRYYWDFFVEGFKSGFNAFFDGVEKALSYFGILNVDLKKVAASIGEFLKKLLGVGQEDSWKAIGEAVGKIAGLTLSVFALIKAFSLFKTVSSGIGKLPLLGGLGGDSSTSSSPSTVGGFLSNPVAVAKTLGSLAIIVGGAVLLITALGALNKIPGFNDFMSSGMSVIGKLFENLIPIVASVGALALVVAVLGRFNIDPVTALKGLGSLAIILGGFDLLITAIGALASIPGFNDFISSGVTTLTSLFSAMSVFASGEFWLMVAATAVLGALSPALVASGIAGLAIIVAGFGVLVSAFGALALIPGFNEFLESGGDTLATLFRQVGKIAGAVVGGALESVSDSLPYVGEQLSAFGSNLAPFFDAVKDAPVDEIGGFMAALGTFVLTFTASDVLSFFGGDLDLASMGTDLSNFGVSAKPFFDTAASFSEDGIKKGQKALELLALIGNADIKTGGMVDWFTGSSDLKKLGQQLSDYGAGAKTYFDTVGGVSLDSIEKGERVLAMLQEIGNTSLNTGGLLQAIVGDLDIATVGTQLSSFAINGRAFFIVVESISEQGFTNALKVFEVLNSMSPLIGASNQLQDGGLSKLGFELSSFIINARGFFTGAADVTTLDSISSLSNTLGEFFGVVVAFDVAKLTAIAAGIDTVSTSATGFSTNLTAIVEVVRTDTESILTAINVCTKGAEAVLVAFASRGTSIGANLMRSIAAGISSNAWMIRNAVQSAVNGINVSVSGIAGKAASSAKRNSMVGLATGGFVKTTGIAVLHPNEVVVNDTLTKRLGLFLDDYTKSTASTPTSPNSVVITPPDPNDTRPTGRPPVVPVPSPVNTGRDNVRTEQPSTPQIDNSVTFAAGSVVIQLANATEAELEKAAEKLMKIIARKQQLKNMATRTV